MRVPPDHPAVRAAVANGLIRAADVPPETEAAFQARVFAFAREHGWAVLHVPRVSVRRGGKLVHLTATVGDGRGFVDAVLVRDRVLFRELKSDRGTLDPEQTRWRDRLHAANADWAVWKPKDWQLVVETLT
jgi:hypothetical protein